MRLGPDEDERDVLRLHVRHAHVVRRGTAVDRRDVLLLEAEQREELDRTRRVHHRDGHMIRVAEHRRPLCIVGRPDGRCRCRRPSRHTLPRPLRDGQPVHRYLAGHAVVTRPMLRCQHRARRSSAERHRGRAGRADLPGGGSARAVGARGGRSWRARSQLELHYQPVVRLDGSGVYGAETFLRWRHPERGVLRAGQWMPYAVQSGAAVPLCAAVLPAWAACARRLPGLVLSFNVGGQDLVDDRYMASMHAVAADGHRRPGGRGPVSPVSSGRAAERPVGRARAGRPDTRLASLQALGFSVWMDNFGCGGTDDETAAVGPTVDVVKLDMSLLGWERGRLTGLVERLHDHGKVVLVEGVESAAHERLAVETGMDLASGYRYAPIADRAAVRRVSGLLSARSRASVDDHPDPADVLDATVRVVHLAPTMCGDSEGGEVRAGRGERVRSSTASSSTYEAASLSNGATTGKSPAPSKSHSAPTIVPAPGGTSTSAENSTVSPTETSARVPPFARERHDRLDTPAVGRARRDDDLAVDELVVRAGGRRGVVFRPRRHVPQRLLQHAAVVDDPRVPRRTRRLVGSDDGRAVHRMVDEPQPVPLVGMAGRAAPRPVAGTNPPAADRRPRRAGIAPRSSCRRSGHSGARPRRCAKRRAEQLGSLRVDRLAGGAELVPLAGSRRPAPDDGDRSGRRGTRCCRSARRRRPRRRATSRSAPGRCRSSRSRCALRRSRRCVRRPRRW